VAAVFVVPPDVEEQSEADTSDSVIAPECAVMRGPETAKSKAGLADSRNFRVTNRQPLALELALFGQMPRKKKNAVRLD